jgi:hypothetical protein
MQALIPHPHVPSPIWTAREFAFDNLVGWLIANSHNSYALERLNELSDLLNALPLSTAEFDVRRARIANAIRYSQSGEYGAAQFELRMLRAAKENKSRHRPRTQKPV